jgi:OmpA-OmpF porin, OOP family
MMRQGRLSRLIAAIGLLMLAGCAGGNVLTSTNNVTALDRAAPQDGTTFTQILAHEYSLFADNQLAEFDYLSADIIARKGLRAAGGEAVPPENVANWHSVPDEARGEIVSEGARLTAALDGGARERAPALAAVAQARYDCWIEEQNENLEAADITRCRTLYLEAMNQLTGQSVAQAPAAPQPPPAAAARQYQVYFDFDKSNLTPDARRIVEQAAAAAKRGTGTIQLVGRADRVGTDAYNLRLSERRAKAVADALVAQGIPRNRISARGVGERELPVPTPEGVREARNRVVDITFQ